VNTILDGFLAVTREEIRPRRKKYLRNEKRAIVFRTPVNAGAKEAAVMATRTVEVAIGVRDFPRSAP